MKVAIVIDSLIRGGAERQALGAVIELVRRGVDARLIMYYAVSEMYAWPSELQDRVILIQKSGRPLRFLWRLCTYLRRERIDVVHGYKDVPSLYACIAGCLAGVPVRIIGHRSQSMPSGWSLTAYRFVNRVASAWVGNAQAVVDALADELGVPADRLWVVHNGLDKAQLTSPMPRNEARARLQIRADCAVVAMIAVMRAGKNHSMFVRMAQRVLASHPRTHFLLVGASDPNEPTCMDDVKKLVCAAGMGDSIRFLGMRADVPDILAATDVSVLTSNFEGMSNAVLESMAAGVSVVTTDHVGAREMLIDGEQGFIVPLNDDEEMASQVCRLLDHPALREQMGQAGQRRIAEHFSMGAMGERLVEIYSKLLAHRGRRRSMSRE